MPPTVEEELKLWAAGCRRIAGVDEVGRGCWAGPVVAAAVVLPKVVLEHPELLAGVDDSKTLTAKQRERLAERILALADGWAIGAGTAGGVNVMASGPALRPALPKISAPL